MLPSTTNEMYVAKQQDQGKYESGTNIAELLTEALGSMFGKEGDGTVKQIFNMYWRELQE